MVVHASVNVLQDHNGIVNDQADGEYQGKQGEQVDGEAHHGQRHEGADDGDRYRDRGNQGGAHVTQEQEDHDHHQPHGDEQGHDDLLNGSGDKDQGVDVDAKRRTL